MDLYTWRILLIDDDQDDYFLVRVMLAQARKDKFLLEWASSYAQAKKALQSDAYDAVLVDYNLGPDNGIDLITETVKAGYPAPMILLTGHGSYEVDLQAMQCGAADYLDKRDLNAGYLERTIRNAIDRKQSMIERERLLEENRLQRDLVERIVQNSVGAIAVLHGPEQRYIMANPAYHAIARKENLIGRTVAEAWPELSEKIVPLLDQVYQTGKPYKAVDTSLNVTRGEQLITAYFSFSYAPFYDRTGEVEGVVVTADETTEEVLARQALVEWEATLRSFFESEVIFAGVIELEEDDVRFVHINSKLASIFDTAPDQVTGKTVRALGIDDKTRVEWINQLNLCLEMQTPIHFEAGHPFHEEQAWFIATISPITTAQGEHPRFAFVAVDITDNKLWERRLADALAETANERNRLEAVLQVMPVGISICDEQGGVLMANRDYDKVWGRPRPETKTVDDYKAYRAWWAESGRPLHPEEWASAQALQKKETIMGQFLRIQRFDDSYAFVMNGASPVVNDQGEIIGSVAAILDITRRVEIENALRESEQRFRVTFENAAVGMSLVGLDGRFLRVNQRMCDITGYSPEELLQKTFQEITYPADIEADLAQLNRVGRGEIDHYRIEKRYIRKDGSIVWTNLTVSAQYAQNSQVEMYISIVEDINQRKAMELAIRESEQRFHIALSSVPMFVFTMDSDLRYTWVYNPRRGYTAEQMLGKNDQEIYPADAAERYMNLKRSVIQTGHGIQLEVKDQNDGNWIYSYVTLEPILDSSGSVIGITGAVLDVTQQRQLEVRQAEYLMQMEVHRRLIQQRELERMNIARDLHDGTLQELTVISYELAEAVRACHEAAEKELLQSAQQKLKQQLQEIRIFCNELRPPALAPFGLETAIRSHVQEYSNRHPELKFHLNLQPDRQTLPEDTRMALFRIYQESLNNIIKHSHASQVWVTWNVDETEASLEIEDDGVGFDLPKDWIAQARTGHLGLIGMRERVESIGGEITFDANPGKGCHIHVRVSR